MEEIERLRETDLGKLKSKTAEEFLEKIRSEDDIVDWEPKIVNERVRRSSSFICAEYHKPACYRAKPKIVQTTAWKCDSPATRQLSQVPRFGPRRFYINNQNIHIANKNYLSGSSTQARGLCFEPRTVTSL